MERKKYMAKIMKFVYTMILFLSIFIITLQVNGNNVSSFDFPSLIHTQSLISF